MGQTKRPSFYTFLVLIHILIFHTLGRVFDKIGNRRDQNNRITEETFIFLILFNQINVHYRRNPRKPNSRRHFFDLFLYSSYN